MTALEMIADVMHDSGCMLDSPFMVAHESCPYELGILVGYIDCNMNNGYRDERVCVKCWTQEVIETDE